MKKPRANIPCPRQFPDGQICGKMHRNEDHLEKHIMVVHEGNKLFKKFHFSIMFESTWQTRCKNL